MAQEAHDDDLLSEDELREALGQADQILAQPAKEYDYRDPSYKGGPRNLSEEEKLAAAIELTSIRVLIEEIEDRLAEARIALVEQCQEQVDQGVPVDWIAEHSGYKHRSSVYRALAQLPSMKAKRASAANLRARIRRAT
jgi:hypothetical protein